MFSEERREEIFAILLREGRCRVYDLASKLKVSEVTIRQDLGFLEQKGLLQRTHGGAILRGKKERAFHEEQKEHQKEKEAIARSALSLIQQKDWVLLDVGTTTTELAKLLPACSPLTVLTNALNIAFLLEDAPGISVVVTGGTLRAQQHSLVNPYAALLLSQVRVDYAFIGVSGIHETHGVTNVNAEEAELKREFLKVARTKVIVADTSKLGRVSYARIGGLADFDLLITDDREPKHIKAIARAGLEVRTAKEEA